jgi:hypothetical protein
MDAQQQVPEQDAGTAPEPEDLPTPEEWLASLQQLLNEQRDEQDEALVARTAEAMIVFGAIILGRRLVELLAADALQRTAERVLGLEPGALSRKP